MKGFGLRLPLTKDTDQKSGARKELFGEGHDHDKDPEKKQSLPVSRLSPNPPTKDEPSIQEPALDDDPQVFDYDAYYERKQRQQVARSQVSSSAGQAAPKYLGAMLEAAHRRQLEREEARLQANRQRAQVGGDENDAVFLTGSYKRRLAEMRQRGIDTESEHRKDGTEDPAPRPLQLPAFYGDVLASRLEREEGRHRKRKESKPPRARSRSPN